MTDLVKYNAKRFKSGTYRHHKVYISCRERLPLMAGQLYDSFEEITIIWQGPFKDVDGDLYFRVETRPRTTWLYARDRLNEGLDQHSIIQTYQLLNDEGASGSV